MESRKQAILAALDAFVRQRPGMEFCNYGDAASYRSESRSITRDLHDYRELERCVSWKDSVTADMLLDAARNAFSGRLTLTVHDAFKETTRPLISVSYCTGQYFPTEYRKAACAVLASALWEWQRTLAMPAATGWRVEAWLRCGETRERSPVLPIHEACELLAAKGGQDYGHISELYRSHNDRLMSAGDWLRAHFRHEFGARLASRWFS